MPPPPPVLTGPHGRRGGRGASFCCRRREGPRRPPLPRAAHPGSCAARVYTHQGQPRTAPHFPAPPLGGAGEGGAFAFRCTSNKRKSAHPQLCGPHTFSCKTSICDRNPPASRVRPGVLYIPIRGTGNSSGACASGVITAIAETPLFSVRCSVTCAATRKPARGNPPHSRTENQARNPPWGKGVGYEEPIGHSWL